MTLAGLRSRVAGLLLISAGLEAQQTVIVTDVGPGAGGRILQEALRRPHRIIEPDTAWFVLRRSETVRTTLIVLGRTAAIAGKVDGDVIVVGGDLFVRPAAEVSGWGVAIGGGVYPSTLSFVGRGSESFRDNTFDVRRTTAGYELAYRSLREGTSRPLLFPGFYGLRVPTYDRVNGASLPFGPALSFGGGRGEVNAIVTYRSNLGAFDPGLTLRYQFGRRSRLELDAKRGTFTNDAWIWSDYLNSFASLTSGYDTRNYYRADRGGVSLYRIWEFTRTQLEPFVGFSAEQAWPVGPVPGGNRAPWSLLRRGDSLGLMRPNPQFNRNDIVSALAGARIEWESEEMSVRLRSLGEQGLDASALANGDFTQVTSDLAVGFPTFGDQEYEIEVHWVTTPGDTPPAQRFVYLGGPGSLPFLNVLEQGGDELLLVDQRYSVPLHRLRLGVFGVPTLQIRHRIGSAGLGKLPDLEQMIGVGVALTLIRAEVQLDPADTKWRFGAGFSFSR